MLVFLQSLETSWNDTQYLQNNLRDPAKRGIRLRRGHKAQLENSRFF